MSSFVVKKLPQTIGLLAVVAIATALLIANTGAAAGAAMNWQTGPGYRWRPLQVPGAGKTGFTLLPPSSTGILVTNSMSAERYLTNSMLLNGSGVAAGDVDGDGLCDLYFCGLDGPNVLYRNLGNWKFEDVTEAAGVACPNLDATGAVFADIDGDGDLDLLVSSLRGGLHICLNDGKGHCTEAANGGLNSNRAGTSMALADIDGDGALDLYLANYRTVTLRDQPNTKFSLRIENGQPVVNSINGRPLTDPDLTNRFVFHVVTGQKGGALVHEENREADVLYHNDGKGHFVHQH